MRDAESPSGCGGAPSPTATEAPFVESLGRDLAIRFFIEFGGAALSYAVAPRGAGRLAALVGRDAAAALGRAALDGRIRLSRRVPLANRWLARSLRHDGMTVAAIARTLRAADVTVRSWLKCPPQGRARPLRTRSPLLPSSGERDTVIFWRP